MLAITYNNINQFRYETLKIIKISGLILLIITMVFIGKYYKEKSLIGNDNIRLIANGNKIKTLEELIQQNEFKGNVLYIDIWGTCCGPCINEFKYVSETKERYNGKPIKFIYLGRERGTITFQAKSTFVYG